MGNGAHGIILMPGSYTEQRENRQYPPFIGKSFAQSSEKYQKTRTARFSVGRIAQIQLPSAAQICPGLGNRDLIICASTSENVFLRSANVCAPVIDCSHQSPIAVSGHNQNNISKSPNKKPKGSARPGRSTSDYD